MHLLVLLQLWAATSIGVMEPAAGDGSAAFTMQPAVCPAAHRNAELRVINLLGSSLYPEIQARFDMGTAFVGDVRLLATARDRETCNALWSAMGENGTDLRPADKVTFFRSGNRYLVPISRSPRRTLPPGTVQLDGESTLDVYDPEYRLIGRFRA